MPTFKDRAFAQEFLHAFWSDLLADPDVGNRLKATGLTAAYVVTDMDLTMYIDATGIKWNDEARRQRPIISFAMAAETVHRFWLRKLNVVKALATGEVRARGPVPQVMKLLPLLKPANAIYVRQCTAFGLPLE